MLDPGRRIAVMPFLVAAAAVLVVSTTPAFSLTSLPAKVKYVKGPDTAIPSDFFNPRQSYPTEAAICPRGWNVVGGGVVGNLDVVFGKVAKAYPTNASGSAPGRRGWIAWINTTCAPVCAAQPTAAVIAICVQGATTSGTWP